MDTGNKIRIDTARFFCLKLLKYNAISDDQKIYSALIAGRYFCMENLSREIPVGLNRAEATLNGLGLDESMEPPILEAYGRRNQMPELPAELKEAFEQGELTMDQLQQLIALEASVLGLTYEDAVRKARTASLPTSWIADDLELLVSMLPS